MQSFNFYFSVFKKSRDIKVGPKWQMLPLLQLQAIELPQVGVFC